MGVVGHILLWHPVASAQQPASSVPTAPAKPPVTAAAEPVGSPVREVQPSLYYLKDKEGNLQPVPNFKFEDFEEMVRRKLRLDQTEQTPRYSLQSLSMTGTAKGNRAELTVKLSFLVRDENWVRIPLRLDQVVLREAVQYQGSGQQFLHFEEAGDGYVCWVRGGQTPPHSLTLNVLAPLSVVGDETRLKLSMPRATTSELRMKVPIEGLTAEVTDGATLLAPTKMSDGSTELTVMGLGGDFELTWCKPGRRSVEPEIVLEAVGAVLVRIDGRNVNTDARLTVRGYADPFDRFQVRLPKGALLVAGNPVGYSLTPVARNAATADDRSVVSVRLPKKTSGPVEIRLATRQSTDAPASPGWIDLAGFEVVEAIRQWGHFALATSGDWHVLWGPTRGVRQVDQLPESLRQESLAAGFEYFSQPCSLAVRIVPRQTRVSVEPEYLLLVEPNQVHLEAKLRYTVRGAKVSALDIELSDWQLDDVGPDNLVAREGVAAQDGVLSIPLLQPATGQIDLTLRARRTVSRDTKSLAVPFPKPRATSSAPAAVVILPADNVEFTPKADAMVGLVRQQVAPLAKLPNRQQDPLYYRGDTAKAVLAGELRVHPQSVAVEVTSQVGLDEGKNQVEQRLAYAIAYEPLDRLMLTVPHALANSDALEILLDGQRLSLLDPLDPSAKDDAGDSVRKRVVLPSARIGSLELSVRYPLDLERVPPGASIIAKVPLVMPAEGKLTGNRLYVTTRPGLNVEHRQGLWTAADKDAELPRPDGLQLVANKWTNEAELAIRLEEQDASASTIVSQAWMQTWLTSAAQQHRAVFRFTSSLKELELTLPPGADAGTLEIWLDREAIKAPVAGEGRLLVPLAGNDAQRPRALDVRYHLSHPRSGIGRVPVQFPRLGRDTWVRRIYWQLVVPVNEHLLIGPADFAGEFAWRWHGLYWGRRPLLKQEQLEEWCGVQRLRPLPPEVNCYLFSSLGVIERAEVYTASRTLIVLGAAGLVLLAGLSLIYVPALRHPAALLTAAVFLACAVLVHPDAALLLGQAGSLGLVMAILAGRLRARKARRTKSLLREVASSVVHHGSSRTQPQVAVSGGEATTATAPAPVALPTSDAVP